jgi:prepilin-type N-terminal cleavage/methylation domain-containing protein
MKRFFKKQIIKSYRGFTMMELMVVIAILSVITFIAIPRFAGLTANASSRANEANARVLTGLAQVIKTDTESYPNSLEAIASEYNGKTYINAIPVYQGMGSYSYNPTTGVVFIDGLNIISSPSEITVTSAVAITETSEPVVSIPTVTQVKVVGNNSVTSGKGSSTLSYQYSAIVLDQFGTIMTGQNVMWAATGMGGNNSISQDGLLSLRNFSSTTTTTITASVGTVSGSKTITVN